MRDDQGILAELERVKGERDRLESLVGTAYHEDGTVIPALLNVLAQTELTQALQEVQAVIGFLRTNDPHREAGAPPA